MYPLVSLLNAWGEAFAAWAGSMLIQSTVVIGVVMLLDLALRRRLRAVFRFWLWMLILAKLVLPPTLAAPYSAGHWLSAARHVLASHRQRPPQPADTSEIYIEPVSYNIEFATSEAIAFSPNHPSLSWEPGASLPEHANVGRLDEITAARLERAATMNFQTEQETQGDIVRLTGKATLLLLWLFVCGCMAAVVVKRTRTTGRLVSQSDEPDEALGLLLISCLNRMRMSNRVSIRLTSALPIPAVYGIIRPVILIPSHVRNGMKRSDLETIILHELAHVRRGDLSIRLLQTILQVVYFYNPLLWPANASMRRVREQAVDETVLAALGAEGIPRYTRALVQAARMALGPPGSKMRLIGVIESKNLLTERIKIMLYRPTPNSARVGTLGIVALTLLGIFLLPMARAQERTAELTPGGWLMPPPPPTAPAAPAVPESPAAEEHAEANLRSAEADVRRSAAPAVPTAAMPLTPPPPARDPYGMGEYDATSPPAPVAPAIPPGQSQPGMPVDNSSDVKDAVKEVLPQILEDLLPKVIEDVLSKLSTLQQKPAAR